MAGTMLMQSFPMPVLAAQTESQDVGYGEASAGTQRDALVKTSKDSEFTVTVPKTIILDSNDAADYTVKVRGSVLADESVSVAPHDDMDTVDGVNFSMAESTGKKADAVATAVQNDTVWSSSEITADGTTKPGSISAEGITAGSWEGNLTFDINMDGSGSGGTGGGNEDPDNPDNPDDTHKHTYVDGVCSDCGEESTIASMPTFSNLRSGGTYPVGTSITCPEGTTLAIDGNETQTDENGVYVFNEVGEYSVLVDYGTSTVNVASAKALNVKGVARDYTPVGATVEMDITIAENPTMNVSNMVNNGTYPEGTKVAVDEGGSLKVNDTETGTEGGSYTIPGTGDYKIEVTDGQGNTYIVNITVNNISMGEVTNPDEPVEQGPGVYTITGKKLCTWDELTLDYGFKVNLHTGSPSTAPGDNKEILKTINPTNANLKVILPELNETMNYTFWGCDKVQKIEFADSEYMFGQYTFAVTPIESITIPSTTTLGSNMFTSCKSLKEVNFTDDGKLTTIDSEAFSLCESLNNVIIPDSVTTIQDTVFNFCTGLTNIHLPSSLTFLNTQLFSNCTSLESIEIPEGVTGIGAYSGYSGIGRVFMNCTALKEVKFPSTLNLIGKEAFLNCKSLDLNVPDHVSSIGENAFKNTAHVAYNGTATGSPWGATSIN